MPREAAPKRRPSRRLAPRCLDQSERTEGETEFPVGGRFIFRMVEEGSKAAEGDGRLYLTFHRGVCASDIGIREPGQAGRHTLIPLPICFLTASPPRATSLRIATHACSRTLLSLSDEAEANPCCHTGMAAAMSWSDFAESSKKEMSSARAFSLVVGSRLTSFLSERTAHHRDSCSACTPGRTSAHS